MENSPVGGRRGYETKLFVDPNLPEHERPSDVLLREHFRQSLIKHLLGSGEDIFTLPIDELTGRRRDKAVEKSWEEICMIIGEHDEPVNLSHAVWQSGIGKYAIERYLWKELYGCLPEVENGDPCLRWNSDRRELLCELRTPDDESEWPDRLQKEEESSVWIYSLDVNNNPIKLMYSEFAQRSSAIDAETAAQKAVVK